MKRWIYCTLAIAAGCASVDQPDKFDEVHFTCDHYEPIRVRFIPAAQTALLIRDDDEIELQKQPAASGYKYSNIKTSIQGKGDTLILTIGKMAPVNCSASDQSVSNR